MDYLTGLQKFIKLTEMYKMRIATEENADRLENGNKFALELSGKIGSVETIVLNFTVPNGKRDISYEDLTTDKKPFFTAYEIKELQKIGSIRKTVNLRRSKSGGDPLYDRLLAQTENIIISGALGYNQTKKTAKNVTGLLSGTFKRV